MRDDFNEYDYLNQCDDDGAWTSTGWRAAAIIVAAAILILAAWILWR